MKGRPCVILDTPALRHVKEAQNHVSMVGGNGSLSPWLKHTKEWQDLCLDGVCSLLIWTTNKAWEFEWALGGRVLKLHCNVIKTFSLIK